MQIIYIYSHNKQKKSDSVIWVWKYIWVFFLILMNDSFRFSIYKFTLRYLCSRKLDFKSNIYVDSSHV